MTRMLQQKGSIKCNRSYSGLFSTDFECLQKIGVSLYIKDTNFCGEIMIYPSYKGGEKRLVFSTSPLVYYTHEGCWLYGPFQVSYVFCNCQICQLFLLHRYGTCGLGARHVSLKHSIFAVGCENLLY